MFAASLIAGVRTRRDMHRRYRRLQAEIDSMNLRELADVCGDRTEMLDNAYFQVYGTVASPPNAAPSTAWTRAGRRHTK